MDFLGEEDEASLLERFKQQQSLLDALTKTNHQLLAAKEEALLAEKMQQLTMCVMEIRPDSLRKKRHSYEEEEAEGMYARRRHQEDFLDDLSDPRDVVYRSAKVDFGAELAGAGQSAPESYQPTPLQQQVNLLSRILMRLQETPWEHNNQKANAALAEMESLSVKMLELQRASTS